MKQAGEISHSGVVRSVSPGEAVVRIVSSSACAACHAAGLCTASEMAEKDITVRVVPGENYAVGEQVEVCLGKSMGTKAVLLAYVVPLFILLILIVSLSYTSLGELAVGLLGLGSVALWYLVLSLFHRRLEGEYRFYIRRK